MRTRIIFTLIFVLCIFPSILRAQFDLPAQPSASILYSQLDASASQLINSGTLYVGGQNFGGGWVGKISSISVVVSGNSGHIVIPQFLTCSVPFVGGVCSGVQDTVNFNNTFPNGYMTLQPDPLKNTVYFDTPYDVTGKYFLFRIFDDGAVGDLKIWGSPGSGNLYCFKQFIPSYVSCDTINLPYFEIRTPDAVNFIIPRSNFTGADFSRWVVGINGSQASSTTKGVIINYGLTGSGYRDQASTTGSGSFQISVNKSQSLSNGVYIAKADFYVNRVPVSSRTISFTINASSTPFIDTGISHAAGIPIVYSTTTDEIICDPESSSLVKAFCWVGYYTIVPSQSSIDKVFSLPLYFFTRPPLSFFTDVLDVWGDFDVPPEVATTSVFSYSYLGSVVSFDTDISDSFPVFGYVRSFFTLFVSLAFTALFTAYIAKFFRR